MLRAVIFLLCNLLFAAAVARAEVPDLAMGLGMESRFEREVNPDYGGLRNNGQLYAKLRFWPWALEVETGQESRDSSSGSLRVDTESTDLSAWGRYEFLAPDRHWSPFAAAGVGAYFDKVQTGFESSLDEHTGIRKFMGAGAGITGTVWNHLMLEAEGRILFVDLDKQPVFSALFRLGYQI